MEALTGTSIYSENVCYTLHLSSFRLTPISSVLVRSILVSGGLYGRFMMPVVLLYRCWGQRNYISLLFDKRFI